MCVGEEVGLKYGKVVGCFGFLSDSMNDVSKGS